MFGRRPRAVTVPRTVTAPANNAEALVPIYTVDPHGAAMFAGIVNGTLGHLGSRPVMSTADAAWHGPTAPPQGFRGDVGAASAGGRPVMPSSTRLDQTRGPSTAPDPIQQIFEERMTARRFE